MFCLVKGREEVGLAKILDSTGSAWTVEYFDGPGANGREVRRVARSQIVKRALSANTRVYYYDDAMASWLVGRVLEDRVEGIDVRFSNKTDVLLGHAQLFVRWKRPIADPVAFLANMITETPQYAEARSIFLDSYIAQRGAAWGISALM